MQAGLIDWFDVELPALVKGARVDILPALRQMLAEAGEALLQRDDGHQLALPLDGGGFDHCAGRCTAAAGGAAAFGAKRSAGQQLASQPS
jgi:hypothetical protein